MSLKRKDLELTYVLRWKNGQKEDKEMSIISVYDIPATTLNFEVFKSYLLKNSGVTDEHGVKVSYIMDNGKDLPIQSQTDFQVALYSFRRKARSGELINLLLEKISDQPTHKNLRHSNDVETQFDNAEPNSLVSTCCNADLPPEWFMSCMAQLKKEVTEDITAAMSSVVSSALTNVKHQVVSQPPCHHHSRKYKPEKRMRKIMPHVVENNTDAKELIKSLKLENKLDKLEYKAAKYREKRLALQGATKSSDSEAGHSSSRSREDGEKQQEPGEPKMDAKPVNCQSVIPHMLGGEIYMHQWEVENIGEAPWTSKTYLQYTWGSKSLKPLNKVISVPYLKPGTRGTISVRLQVPNESGKYECYWQFTHKERRFGHWLGCQVIVDSFDLKGNRSVLDTAGLAVENHFSAEPKLEENFAEYPEDFAALQNFLRGTESEAPKKSPETANSAEALASLYKSLQADKSTDHSDSVKNITEQLVREVTENIERINLHENLDSDSNCSFYDNESLLEGYASSKNSFKDEFVVVPVPKCFILEEHGSAGVKTGETAEAGVPKGSQNVKKEPEDATAHIVKKESLEQAGCSGIKKSAEKVLNTAENNFDDNNNNESVSGASGNSIKLRDEDLDNIVVITVPKDEQVKDGYIYVHVDGQKVLIPKNILKSEVVNAAQELEKSPSSRNSIGVIVDSIEAVNQTPTPSLASTLTRQASHQSVTKVEENAGNTTDSVPVPESQGATSPKQDNIAIDMTMSSFKDNDYVHGEEPTASNYFEANNYMSHCSAAGSCFSEINSQSEMNKRLFVFPQTVPGFEVVHPVLNVDDPLYPNLTHETFAPPPSSDPYNVPANPFAEHVPNFQQTPPEKRTAPVPPTIPLFANGNQSWACNNGRAANQDEKAGVRSGANQAAGAVPQATAFTDPLFATGNQSSPYNNGFKGGPSGHAANQDENAGVRSGADQAAAAAPQAAAPVHILPEALVSGAVNAASSAINTARSVMNMIKPTPPGRWINGHWVSSSPQTPREANLQALAEMGFWNRDLNATLLARFNDDLNRVVAELVQ